MISFRKGSIFDSHAQTLVNPINCVGVMGKGLALQFKTRFPAMHADYVIRCRARSVRLGYPYLFKSPLLPWILNFPTKDHWRSLSSLDDIEHGLHVLRQSAQTWGITSLAVPALGCGNGQLPWEAVRALLHQYLVHLPFPVDLYGPVPRALTAAYPTHVSSLEIP